MAEPVLKLCPEAGLEVRRQVELAAVVAPVVLAAQRHDAVGVVAAARRTRHKVS